MSAKLLILTLFLSKSAAEHPRNGLGCEVDSDCQSGGMEICGLDKKCHQKALFPLHEMEFWGLIQLIYILFIANVGGVGGGGVQFPCLIGFFKLGAKFAIPLSNFSIFLSSFIRYIANRKKPHPLKEGTGLLVDYDYGMIMLPCIVSGISIGGIIHYIMPEIIINIVFIIIMLTVPVSGFIKCLQMIKEENKVLYGSADDLALKP